MTDDSEGDRSQKTVAELIAQHGGSTGGGRRRRRRAAEEDDDQAAPGDTRSISDTAPQAIIDRIQGEGEREGEARGSQASAGSPDGTPHRANGAAAPPAQPPVPQGQPRQARPQAQPPQPPQPSRQAQQPAQPPPQARPPRQAPAPPQQSGPMSLPQTQQDSEPVAARLDGPQAAPDDAPERTQGETPGGEPHAQSDAPARPARGKGGFPWPPNGRRAPLRPARRAEPEPNTDRFPAISAGGQPAGQQSADVQHEAGQGVPASAPPAGLAKWRQRRKQAQSEDTEVGAVPPVPAEQDAGPPTGAFTPSFDTGTQDTVDDYEDYQDYDYFADEAGQDYEDYAGYPDYDDEEGFSDTDLDEFDDYADEADEDYADDEPEEAGSPARQWLVLAGQLALGVVGGAGVWLGFNWLWGQMPSAALIAALVATLGLVWVVRKVRRAEDTQTTVLALLVGLVVTVSPAALLLVNR